MSQLHNLVTYPLDLLIDINYMVQDRIFNMCFLFVCLFLPLTSYFNIPYIKSYKAALICLRRQTKILKIHYIIDIMKKVKELQELIAVLSKIIYKFLSC